jgi:hypothetical protein
MVTRLTEEDLVHGSAAELQALADLSEKELEVLQAIKARLVAAIGEDHVHRPEDGGLFW